MTWAFQMAKFFESREELFLYALRDCIDGSCIAIAFSHTPLGNQLEGWLEAAIHDGGIPESILTDHALSADNEALSNWARRRSVTVISATPVTAMPDERMMRSALRRLEEVSPNHSNLNSLAVLHALAEWRIDYNLHL
ncbi:hypothetical protein [Cupriavidus oxalaticus]|uniref:Uncharacterized protein n=1 Tax=Cupriavidus oxalaticus TaxID=96344 RepID=A0A4P7LCD8_9BURK|nr:hypothetical protein [Cupriavidus oxalaticus]QBY51749.1 hypothetical protein E0W60_10880 [Cupriavidus oxalaticus]